MKNIKFIYFDVGGVLILDLTGGNKWHNFKKDLGFTEETIPLFDQLWDKYTSRVNLDYDIDDFAQVIRDEANIKLPDNFSILEEFVNRFRPNPDLGKLIKTWANTYKIGLLTNMYPRMLSKINEAGLLPQYDWAVVIDSSEVGMEKPTPRIYELAEHKAQVKPEEILFVDNLLENLVIPQQRGWQTFLYDTLSPKRSADELVSVFS